MDIKRRLFALRVKWETVRKEFGVRAILDALFAGILYATLVLIPVVIAIVEVMIFSLHLVNLFAMILILVALGYVAGVNALAAYALRLKKPDHESDVRGLFLIHACFWGAVVLIVGLLFLTVFIPAIMA
jgi:hypothetical protein